jgi:hypothetical protein
MAVPRRRVTRGATPTPIVSGALNIHPAIGIARLGNDPTNFFLGPEIPGAGPVGADSGVGTPVTGGPFSGFKTGAAAVKRQGQRFYIFLHPLAGPPIEANLNNPQVKSIEWSVHLANKKAAFFKFDGQKGNSAGSVYSPATRPRNELEPRSRKVIDPGKPLTISGASQGPKKIDFKMGGSWPIHKQTGKVVIGLLGELFTDSAGRLVVLGGRGATRPFLSPQPKMDDYANNDGWLDDVSDGVVSATVTMQSGLVVVARSSWLLVGPPDFAPDVRHVVSMYDLLWDVAARNSSIPIPNLPMFQREPLLRMSTFRNNLAGYRPHFSADIKPFMQSTVDQAAVVGGVVHSMPANALATKQEGGITLFVRPPSGNQIFNLAPGSMPFLYGDNYITAPLTNQAALAVTVSQFTNLERWRDGKIDDSPLPTTVTPEGLDRAALESCAGGAFFPGIEAGWMIRNPILFEAPFRLKPVGTVLNAGMTPPLKIEPGLFSQQMALPWQADFYSCADGNAPDGSANPRYSWWPAQRPIVVKQGANSVRWDRGLGPALSAMITGWTTRGFVVKGGGGGFSEQGGPP